MIRVAILGTGKIGTDLALKVLRSKKLSLVAFVGRSPDSEGIRRVTTTGVPCYSDGIDALVMRPDTFDLVFDCTSARDATEHAIIFKTMGKRVVDLTPSRVGSFFVPAIDAQDGALPTSASRSNVNTITCGGQASIPIAWALATSQRTTVEYIEVVSSIASKSAGPATRRNLDEYIATTERGILQYTGCKRAKAILNLNPAVPEIDMQTTVLAKVTNPDVRAFDAKLAEVVERVRKYVPNYEVIVRPVVESGRVVTMVRIRGLGDYLPAYAGNLDIINCAAIAAAEGM